MMLEDLAFILNGPAGEGPGWEQQQGCEEHQHFEECLEELSNRINNHLEGIELALSEMQKLQSVLASEYMSIGHILMKGGQNHEL